MEVLVVSVLVLVCTYHGIGIVGGVEVLVLKEGREGGWEDKKKGGRKEKGKEKTCVVRLFSGRDRRNAAVFLSLIPPLSLHTGEKHCATTVRMY